MMKIFKSLAAIALVAFAASCSNELLENSPSYNGEEAVVNFSVATPGLMTRAVADGSTVNTVECYVYDKDGKLIEGIGKSATMEGGKADISLRLMTGQTYSFAFWAYKAPEVGATSPYTFNKETKTLSVSYANATTNDENRDAFYAYIDSKEITGSLKEPVTLSRPFAQLNFGVEKPDVEAATALGVTVAKSSLSLKGLGNELNLATGEVKGEVDATFSIASLLSEDLTVNNVDYGYVSMNYVLVGKSQKTTTDAKLSLYDDKGDFINAISLPNVPLQGNYRTNIIGKLYTSQADFQIVVDPAFEGGYNVERISIPAGFSGIYNLPNTSDDVLLNIEGDCTDENGITIAYASGESVNEPANVTINAGSHKISVLKINLEKSHVDVVGGTFQTMSGVTNTNTLALSNSTKITGTLEVAKGSVEIACEVATVEVKETVTAEAKIVLAPTAKITSSMTTTSSAPIVVKATPAKDAASEGQVEQQATVTSIVVKAPQASSEPGATEYKAPVIELQDGATLASNAVQAADGITVNQIETATAIGENGEELEASIVVKDYETLEYALANGRNVKLGANITLSATIALSCDLIIDLGGYSLNAGENATYSVDNNNQTMLIAVNGYKLSVMNGTLGSDDAACNYAIYSNNDQSNVVLEDVTFGKNVAYAYYGAGKLEAKNSKFYGWISGWNQGGTFTNCEFGVGKAYYPAAICHSNTTFEGCKFFKNNVNADDYSAPDTDGFYRCNYVIAAAKPTESICFKNCKYMDANGVETTVTVKAHPYHYEGCPKAWASVNAAAASVTVDGAEVTYRCDDWDGSISQPKTDENGNYLISKASELAWIAKQVNEGANTFSGKTVYLNADIDLCNVNWTPIGLYGGKDKSFQGTFDGQNRTISNLYVHSNVQSANLGLFGRVLSGSVKNFTVKGADIASEVSVCSGSACGVAVGNLFTSTAEGIKVYNAKVYSTHYVGGVIGSGYCSISNCSVENAELTAVTALLANGSEYDEGDKVGGILGHWGEGSYEISNCSVKKVSIKGYRDLGGIVGIAMQNNSVKDCSIEDVTITVDKTHNYKDYKTTASFNANNYIGRYESWTGTETGNTGTATVNYL